MRVGLERVGSYNYNNWGRVGLLANQASINSDLVPAHRILKKLLGESLVALFGPQHGFMGVDQYNMIETSHGKHIETGLPVYSLYAETRRPTQEMLNGIDTLIIDLQISGCRIYTWKATIDLCLSAAKENGKKVVILDRPNPVGGKYVEGRVLDKEAFSFVGCAQIPMRHGLSSAEAAKFINKKHGADLEVVELDGWNTSLMADSWLRPWVLTSPMLPSFDSVVVYPGMVLIEGTNLSEGRGTTLPFQLIGAPYILDSQKFIDKLSKDFPSVLGGIRLREASFIPTWNKWEGKTCNGIHIIVEDPTKVTSYGLTLAIIQVAQSLYPDGFEWEKPGYEYNFEDLPIDLLIGNLKAHTKFGSEFSLSDAFWNDGIDQFIEKSRDCLLYDRSLIKVTQ